MATQDRAESRQGQPLEFVENPSVSAFQRFLRDGTDYRPTLLEESINSRNELRSAAELRAKSHGGSASF